MSAIGVLPIVGAILGGIQLLDTMARADSAPQQAAGMAMACALAVVPYVFARGVEMMSARPSAQFPAGADVSPQPLGSPVVPSTRKRVMWALILLVLIALATLPVIPDFWSGHQREVERARELDAIDKMNR